jgi:hypothetical protein
MVAVVAVSLWSTAPSCAYFALSTSDSERAGSFGAMKITVSSGSGWCPYDMNPGGMPSLENWMSAVPKILRTASVVGFSGPKIFTPQKSVVTYRRTSIDKSQWVLSPTKYLPISYARYADSWSPSRYEKTILRGTDSGTAAIADRSFAMVPEFNSRHAILSSSARFFALKSAASLFSSADLLSDSDARLIAVPAVRVA